MTSAAVRRLRDALGDRHDELAAAFFVQGTVTAVVGNAVTVALPGATSAITVPRLKAYSSPAVGDVVWLAGPPGSWFCLGPLA